MEAEGWGESGKSFGAGVVSGRTCDCVGWLAGHPRVETTHGRGTGELRTCWSTRGAQAPPPRE